MDSVKLEVNEECTVRDGISIDDIGGEFGTPKHWIHCFLFHKITSVKEYFAPNVLWLCLHYCKERRWENARKCVDMLCSLLYLCFFFPTITKDSKSWIIELVLNVEGKIGWQCYRKRVFGCDFWLGVVCLNTQCYKGTNCMWVQSSLLRIWPCQKFLC